MIFKPELLSKIWTGEKTQTRRAFSERLYLVGRSYAVQPGRGSGEVGRIYVTDERSELLGDISAGDARLEGFASRDEFVAYWHRLHGSFSAQQRVSVITFEQLGQVLVGASGRRCGDCRCMGEHHYVRSVGDTFGTRCRRWPEHGGHKFWPIAVAVEEG